MDNPILASSSSETREPESVRPGDSLPFFLRYLPLPIFRRLLNLRWFTRIVANVPSVYARLDREPALKMAVDRFLSGHPHHVYVDRGDGMCEICKEHLLVGRSTPHEATAPTEAKP
jgi:hypothetical protein